MVSGLHSGVFIREYMTSDTIAWDGLGAEHNNRCINHQIQNFHFVLPLTVPYTAYVYKHLFKHPSHLPRRSHISTSRTNLLRSQHIYIYMADSALLNTVQEMTSL